MDYSLNSKMQKPSSPKWMIIRNRFSEATQSAQTEATQSAQTEATQSARNTKPLQHKFNPKRSFHHASRLLGLAEFQNSKNSHSYITHIQPQIKATKIPSNHQKFENMGKTVFQKTNLENEQNGIGKTNIRQCLMNMRKEKKVDEKMEEVEGQKNREKEETKMKIGVREMKIEQRNTGISSQQSEQNLQKVNECESGKDKIIKMPILRKNTSQFNNFQVEDELTNPRM